MRRSRGGIDPAIAGSGLTADKTLKSRLIVGSEATRPYTSGWFRSHGANASDKPAATPEPFTIDVRITPPACDPTPSPTASTPIDG